MYLHELHRINRNTVRNKCVDIGQADRFRKELLEPDKKIAPDDGIDKVLIDKRIFITDRIFVRTVFIVADDVALVYERDSVIWNKRRWQEGVCDSAHRALHSANREGRNTFGKKNATFIVTVDRKAGRMPADAGDLVELEAVDNGIVIIL